MSKITLKPTEFIINIVDDGHTLHFILRNPHAEAGLEYDEEAYRVLEASMQHFRKLRPKITMPIKPIIDDSDTEYDD